MHWNSHNKEADEGISIINNSINDAVKIYVCDVHAYVKVTTAYVFFFFFFIESIKSKEFHWNIRAYNISMTTWHFGFQHSKSEEPKIDFNSEWTFFSQVYLISMELYRIMK